MTDLTYCYVHMKRDDLLVLDTVETSEFLKGELSDDDLDIPVHMVPPNPDDSDNPVLPSQVHPSYPYGNPTNIKHPSSRPRPRYDPFSRALFEDMGYNGGGIAGALRWRDLAMDELLPVDEEKELAERAMQARKMASGASNNNPQQQQQQQQQQQHQPPQMQQNQPIDEDDEDSEENDENEDDDDADDETDESEDE